MTRDAWKDHANCYRRPSLPWIAEPGTAPEVLVAQMVDECAACPVRKTCEAYVVSEKVTGGYWAGQYRTYPPTAQETLPLDGAA